MFKKSITPIAVLYPFIMISLMGIGYFLQHSGLIQGCWGAIIPLVGAGFKGIFFSPFLHGNLEHLLGNMLPVAVLMFLLFQFYTPIAKKIFFLGWFLAGFLVWLLPPVDFFTGSHLYTCVIGASGLVYVLAFFLFVSGVLRKERTLLTVSLLVALYYGSLIWGVLPEELFVKLDEPSKISWQSHLAGALVGIILAFTFRGKAEKKKKFIWEFPNYYSEKDDKLWQQYREAHPDDFSEMPQKHKDEVWKYLDEIRHDNKS